MKERVKRVRNLADYGYPSNDIAVLSEKALEVTRRLTDLYGELPFSSKDPMGMLVDILLSHRTRDEQTAAAWVGQSFKAVWLLGRSARCTNG